MVLNNSQYDAIMREYHAKQIHAKNDLDRRTAEVLVTVPEYKVLQDRISEISVNAASAAMRGDDKATVRLNQEIRNIEQQMKKLLKEGGFSSDYLELRYSCAACQDTGYVLNTKCSCFKQAQINLLYNQSNLKHILDTENFDAFSLDYYSNNSTDDKTGETPRENAARVLDTCKHFASHFPSGESLLFYGFTGVGKTFLSHCIAKEVLDRSYSVLYLSAIDFFKAFSPQENIVDNYGLDFLPPEMQIINCDLLIIDDLGTELANSFTNSKFFLCINNRIMANKSTIISTNLSLSELQRNYSERIFSRIYNSYSLLKMYGDDIRIQKKKI